MKFNLTAEEFLADLVPIIKDLIVKIKQKPTDDFEAGLVFAYYDVLSIVQMQAENFEIDLKEIGLDYQLESELIYSNAERN